MKKKTYKQTFFNCFIPPNKKELKIRPNYQIINIDDNNYQLYNEVNNYIINRKDLKKLENFRDYREDIFIKKMIEMKFIA